MFSAKHKRAEATLRAELQRVQAELATTRAELQRANAAIASRKTEVAGLRMRMGEMIGAAT